MKLTIDFETRGTVDLIKCGAQAYAEGPDTDILCMSIKLDNNPAQIWVPDKFQHLAKGRHSYYGVFKAELIIALEKADTIEAHNIFFELSIWHHVMHKRYGFPDLPFEKLRCSAAKAAIHSLPRSLGGAAAALGVEQQKDKEGYKIMVKMCKPRKALKADKEQYPDTWESMIFWHEKPEEFIKLCEYCMQDVEAEHSLSEALPDMTPQELEMFQLDLKINNRGIKVDIPAIDKLKVHVEAKKAGLLDEVKDLTNGVVKSPKQTVVSIGWLGENGLDMPNMQKETVIQALKLKGLSPAVRRFLQISQSIGKASVSKLDAMKRWANADGRVRGSMLFNGANTGRWSGKGIQPQNFVRNSYPEYDIDRILKHNSYQDIDYDYGCAIQAASNCLRGMLTCEPGNILYCADFSSIEAVVLAWNAGEEKILNNFRNKLDAYKVAASAIYDVTYEEVVPDQRKIGKVSELACGFGGGVNAFVSMAPTYGVYVEKKRARQIVKAWRADRPKTVDFWAGVENAAVSAIRTGQPCSYNGITYEVKGRFLKCRLHSGRELAYCDPELKLSYVTNHACKNEDCENFWNKKSYIDYPREDKTCPECGSADLNVYTSNKEDIRFMGILSKNNQWCRQATYGGKLTENIIQAEANDLLREALIRLDAAGYPTVLHVHDEVIAELPKASNLTFENFIKIMSQVPAWATGMPIGADGWVGTRYRKG